MASDSWPGTVPRRNPARDPDPFAVTDPTDVPEAYPQEWAGDVVLRDGGTCHIRPIVPGDRDAVQAMHLAQSDRSRYLRFFAPVPRISERDLDRFTQVDYVERVALVAIVRNRIVGIGRYDVVHSGEAEVAFNIADSQQGRGLGSVLLEHLSAAARERGVTRFVAEVLPENRKMVSVFADAGYEVTHHFDDGVISLEFDIEPTTRSIAVVTSRERRAEAASLRQILRASSVAVLGATDERSSIGRMVLKNILAGNFTGDVHPVHPTAEVVCGLPVYPTIAHIEGSVDIAVICVGLDHVLAAAEQCGAAGVRGLVVVTDGFLGDEGARLERQLAHVSRAAGMRVIGPASLGLVNTHPEVQLNASLLPMTLRPGGLSLFSQSAGLGLTLLAEAMDRGLGVASVVSAGDRADVSGNDLLQYWAEDDHTQVIAMYTESSGNPRKFSRIARSVSHTKPVVMVRSWTSGLASNSTTGRASKAPRKAFDSMLRQAGVIQVPDVHQLVETVQLLSQQPLPAGPRAGIVTNSHLLHGLFQEACLGWQLEPAPEPFLVKELTPAGIAEGFRQAAEADLDSIVIAFVPHIDGFGEGVLEELIRFAESYGKPVAGCLVGYQVIRPETSMTLGPVPLYATPEDAVRALAAVTRYALWRRRDHGRPVDPPGCQPERAKAIVDARLAASRHPSGLRLDHTTTRELLSCYGIQLVPSEKVSTLDEAVAAAARLGYPLAVKYADRTLRERRDVTGAHLGIDDEDELRADLADMMMLDDPAVTRGFIVQPMVPSGVAVDIATVEDPLFGPLLSFGLSGDAIDLLGDVAYRIPPLTTVDAADLVREVRAAPRLFGYGGVPKLAIDDLEDLVARVSRLAEDLPEVASLDLRPILVTPGSVNPLWARIRLAQPPNRVDTGLVRKL